MLETIWDSVKEVLMKEFNRRKAALEQTISNLKEGLALLESSDTALQLDGLKRLKAELEAFLESGSGKLLVQSKKTKLVPVANLLLALQKQLQEAIEAFENREQQEKYRVLVRQKVEDLLLKFTSTVVGKNRYAMLLAKPLAVAASAGLIYLLSIYSFQNQGFEKESLSVLFPFHTYESVEEDSARTFYSFTSDAKEHYFEEFTEFYFGPEDSTEHPFNDTLISFKTVFENNSGHFPLNLSNISLQVSYQEKDFDWSQVNTDVDLEHSFDQESLSLSFGNRLPAPMINVRVSTDAGRTENYPIKREAEEVSVLAPRPRFKVGELDPSGKLKEPLFFSYDAINEVWNKEYKVEDADTLIWDLDILKQFIAGKLVEQVAWTIVYEDLRGNKDSVSGKETLTEPYWVYPPSYDSSLIFDGSGFFKSGMDVANHALLLLGHQPVVDPNGVELYVDSLKLNLTGMEDSGVKERVKYLNIVMNPDGRVVLYGKMKEPENGFYSVVVRANDLEVDQFKIESIVAPVKRFKYPEDLKFFQPE